MQKELPMRVMLMAICHGVLAFALMTTGCSKSDDSKDASTEVDPEEDDDLASFTLKLENSSSSLTAVATSLTAKLGGVDLIADCAGDAPPGNCLDLGRAPDPDFWVNSGCNDDIAQCTTANTEFFELIDPTAANVVLNSQGRSIEPVSLQRLESIFLTMMRAMQSSAITLHQAFALAFL